MVGQKPLLTNIQVDTWSLLAISLSERCSLLKNHFVASWLLRNLVCHLYWHLGFYCFFAAAVVLTIVYVAISLLLMVRIDICN